MKNRFLSLITLLSIGVSLSSAEEAWTELLTEVELTEYYFDFEEDAEPGDVFEIKADKSLLIKGKDQPEGYIQTLDEYEDYEIMFEYRWPDEPGKSGIIIHCSSDTSFSIWPEGVEIQLEPERSGDFWLLNTKMEVNEDQMPEKAAERNRRLRLKPSKKANSLEREKQKIIEKEPDEWNKMRIVAYQDTIKVYLNGRLANEGKDVSVTTGFISFQAEDSNLEIRSLKIRDYAE